jgi:hypothetical protein
MRWLGVVVGTAGYSEVVLPGDREISTGVVRRVLAVMRFERVEAAAYEAGNELVVSEQSGMRKRGEAV